jgi:uncharacterized protein (TIGR03118 family)
MKQRVWLVLAAAGLILAGAAAPVAADDHDRRDDSHNHRGANAYTVMNLVSDGAVPAAHVDPNLVNGWGLVAGPTTPWWVANNGTDTSTLYDGTGVARPLVVAVPGGPTGAVFNGSTDFVVSGGGASGPARFLFANEAGMVLGWSPTVPAAGSTQAQVGADRSSVGAIYKGLAVGHVGTANYLYATDFHNGRIDVFNGAFALQSWPGAFVDPKLPMGYAPFGIQSLGGRIFVTYAKQDAAATDEIAGQGRGFVSVFGTDGTFQGRVASRHDLNAPWGLAMAPASGFGRFSGDLLVGNFGDGRIHAFRWKSGHWKEDGVLRGTNHKAVAIDGLWGIGFGNGSASGPITTLYFAAGPSDEAHGLFGSISAAP